MDRREALACMTTAPMSWVRMFTEPQAAPNVTPAFDMPDDPRKQEYIICKRRGHQADLSDPFTLHASVIAVLRRIPFFYVCRWCKTTYRFDNGILHETGAPE